VGEVALLSKEVQCHFLLFYLIFRPDLRMPFRKMRAVAVTLPRGTLVASLVPFLRFARQFTYGVWV
jgi:hypothetical protein